MRPLRLTIALLLGACAADTDTDKPAPNDESSCDTGLRIHEAALLAARDKAPACSVNEDCVAFPQAVSCPGLIQIGLCDVAVHRLVVEYYDRPAVGQALCEASAGNVLGCNINASCAAHGQPVCSAGECTFADEPT